MNKEQLREYKDLKRERDDLERKIKVLELEMYGPRAQRMDGMPRGGSGENNVREEQMDTKAELLELYRAKEAELSQQLLAIEQAIETLDSRSRHLIRLHYIDGLTWEQVCVAMNYSWSQVHRFHRVALARLREKEAGEHEQRPNKPEQAADYAEI